MIPGQDCSFPLKQWDPVGDLDTLGTLVNDNKVEGGFRELMTKYSVTCTSVGTAYHLGFVEYLFNGGLFDSSNFLPQVFHLISELFPLGSVV